MYIYTATLIFRCTDKHVFHLTPVTVVSLYLFLSMHQGKDIFLEENGKKAKESKTTLFQNRKMAEMFVW